jgi:aminoglycoside phosphotransferase (APT) family kinase protein
MNPTPQPPDVLARRLAAALQRAFRASGELLSLQRLSGGATKQTWSFDWSADGRREPMILQLTAAPENGPAQATGGTPKLGAEQDAALMTLAREGGVPAPRVRLVLQPADDLGSGYVTDRVDGETLGKRIVQDAAFASARRVLGRQCGAALAAIHRLPAERLPFLARLSPATP